MDGEATAAAGKRPFIRHAVKESAVTSPYAGQHRWATRWGRPLYRLAIRGLLWGAATSVGALAVHWLWTWGQQQ